MIIIDEALPSDIPQLCDLLACLFAQEQEFQPDAGKQSVALSLLIGNPQRGRVFVLRHGFFVSDMLPCRMLL